ncbi:hypothetical protein Pint_34308 [Pistacia integerrima]|uniref:Uncharacterized protein n=1 Tax=Pistacia integerrima TaxID=434235 RepID=A0ACC0X2X8_9ROSI|nr:hypothetical protein Pint_34308 [Pistacia integerrima]
MAIQAQLYSENNNVGYGFGFALCGSSQDWMMENGNGNGCCGVGNGGFNQFCFETQQKQLQQQQHFYQLQNQQHQRNNITTSQSLCFDTNSANFLKNSSNSNTNTYHHHQSMPFSQTMALQVEKQRQEIDHYIRSQNERLRMVLQEQRKQQLGMLLKKLEVKASTLLRQKDEEIAKATNRAMELEILLKKLETESQAWQRIAQENELMVYSLNNTIEQLREKGSCCFNNGVEDAESCCDLPEREKEEETERNRAGNCIDCGENKDEERTRKMMIMVNVCKGCNSGDSCVLFLPCRHLCSCQNCEAFLESCPVCLTPKKASIEALIF